jgi:hypothetical protein
MLEDEEMIATAKRYIDSIISKQQSDGWLCPCRKEQRAKYDTWALQLICKTLIVYYDCSGDDRIPDVVYKAIPVVMENFSAFAGKVDTLHLYEFFPTRHIISVKLAK